LMIAIVIYYFIKVLTDALDDASKEMKERLVVEKELKKQAITDYLTEVHNRRHFFDLSTIEYSKAVRYHRNIALMIIDIDHFKDVNDTFGHDVGDQALVHFSKLLKSNIRETDILARFGGEEFIVLLPETRCDSATQMAERIRKVIETTPFFASDKPIPLTMSAGVAGEGITKQVDSLEELIRKADDALYDAKRSGRNKVVTNKDLCIRSGSEQAPPTP